jgi:4-amino-4-deoxy-L-arabinose transferase-like glycosyltransferase
MKSTRPVAHSELTQPPGGGTPRFRSQRTLLVAAYGGLLALGLFLLFYNLDGRLLWGDEAETGVLARNVLRFGYPKTFDGLNNVSVYGTGIDSVGTAWVWSPWLQEYVAAASFLLFGATTWAARAPFALIGWLCLPGLGWVVHRIYRQHRMALAAMALLASSEVFLLHARQCRYYSISVLGEIVFIYAIYEWLANHRRGWWLLVLSLVLEFYANYQFAAANAPVLLVLGWTLYRREKRAVLRLGLSLALVVCLAAPWVIFARLGRQSGTLSLDYFFPKIAFYLSGFHFHFVPLLIFILPLAGWLAQKFRRPAGGRRAAVAAAGPNDQAGRVVQSETATVRIFEWHVLFLLPSYAAIVALPPDAFLRYILPLLPAACLLASVWIFRYLRWRFVAIGTVLTLCLTNALAVASGYPFRGTHHWRWPLFDFIGSVAAPYDNREADVVAYLNREARPGQTVFSYDPEFPLIFYTSCQIVDARLQAAKPPAQLPDWILAESACGILSVPPLVLSPDMAPAYDQITISVHASARFGCLPDPDFYEYHSAAMGPYVLFKRKNTP